MRMKMKKKTVILASAAIALTASLTIGSAMAYFTDYTTASGSVTLDIGFSETIPNEKVDRNGKHVTIENVGQYDCFVRVKVFSVIDVGYAPTNGWEKGADDYWYYKNLVSPGESTSELLVSYEFPADEEVDEFDIVVVQECTAVLYGEDGTPYADWNRVITDTTSD